MASDVASVHERQHIRRNCLPLVAHLPHPPLATDRRSVGPRYRNVPLGRVDGSTHHRLRILELAPLYRVPWM